MGFFVCPLDRPRQDAVQLRADFQINLCVLPHHRKLREVLDDKALDFCWVRSQKKMGSSRSSSFLRSLC